jgi:hypothetical protein
MIYNHEVDDARPHERRSMRFNANMAARRAFLHRYGDAARDAGVRHLYCLDITKRHLRHLGGDCNEARWMLVRALRERPSQLRLYAWLAFLSFLPHGLRARLAPNLEPSDWDWVRRLLDKVKNVRKGPPDIRSATQRD